MSSRANQSKFVRTHKLNKNAKSCSVCLKKTKYTCYCGIRFCDYTCKSLSEHTSTCGTRKADRMRKYVEYMRSNAISNITRPYVNISCMGYDETPPFWRLNSERGESYCAVCSDLIPVQRWIWYAVKRDSEHELCMTYKTVVITYRRCALCTEKNKRLLRGSFLTVHETKLWLLFCTRKYNLCKDLRIYLCAVLERTLRKKILEYE